MRSLKASSTSHRPTGDTVCKTIHDEPGLNEDTTASVGAVNSVCSAEFLGFLRILIFYSLAQQSHQLLD